MRAGKLDRTLYVERLTTTLDDYGVPVESWLNIAELRAERVKATAEEIMRDFGESSEAAITFRTRYLDGLTLADRVLFEGAVCDVKSIEEIGRRRGLLIQTMVRGL